MPDNALEARSFLKETHSRMHPALADTHTALDFQQFSDCVLHSSYNGNYLRSIAMATVASVKAN